jgi:hypothetical protein
LTADTALRLSQWLGTSAEIWLNLQKRYEVRLTEQQEGKKIKRTIVRRVATPVFWFSQAISHCCARCARYCVDAVGRYSAPDCSRISAG